MKQFIAQKTRRFAVFIFTLFLAVVPTITSAQSAGIKKEDRGWQAAIDPMYWVAEIAKFIFGIISWITAKMGELMNWTIEFFILEMSDKINSIDAIDSLWQILRDLGNIVFIFIILYAAISIILGSDRNAKEILPRVLVVALLVNFSLFAAQFIVDTSNVLALQIYDNINIDTSELNDPSGVNLSNAIADQVNLSSINSDEGLAYIQDNTNQDSRVGILYLLSAGVVGLLGFVYAAFAALVTIRFFVLMLLMIASPIAFVALALPEVNWGEDWFNWLINQSFFAPAMMLMLFLTLKIGSSMKESLFSENGDLAQAIISPGGNIDILIFYAVMVGLLIASLIVAQQMGAVGADKAVSTGKSIGDWGRTKVTNGVAGATAGTAAYAGRTSVGRAGRGIANNEWLKKKESEGGFGGYLAQQTRRAGEATADSSFDVRNTSVVDGGGDFNRREGGINEAIQDQKEFREEREESIKELGPEEKRRAERAKVARDELESKKKDLDDDLTEINSTFNDIEQLQKEKRQAQQNDDVSQEYINELDEKISDKVDSVKDDLDEETYEALGVDTDDDGDLEEFKENIEDPEHLDQMRDGIEQVIDDAGDEMKRLEEQHIKKGEKRAEAYQENMLTQKSLMDIAGTETTTKTKGNKEYGIDNISNIENNEKFRQDIENEMVEGDIDSSVELSETTTTESPDTTDSGESTIDDELQQKLDNVPKPPQESGHKKLSQALDQASSKLDTMLDKGTDKAIDNINDMLDTAESSPYVRGGDGSGNIEYQDRNDAGEFQEKQSSSTDEMAQRKVQEESDLEAPDSDDNDNT